MKDKLKVFIERLKKIGINIELVGNYPWIYLHRINKKKSLKSSKEITDLQLLF